MTPECNLLDGQKVIADHLYSVATTIPADNLVNELFKDTLTNAWNRKAFEQLTCSKIVGMVDVDSLKWVNDSFGHVAGDNLINEVCDTLLELFPGRVFRISGDEFIVPGATVDELRVKLGFKNIKYSFGVGIDLLTADTELAKDKRCRLEYGLRAPRGKRPIWL